MTETEAPPRILFVDDEPSLLDGLRRQLRREFAVETATSGKQGLAVLEENGPFDVVVSDFRMPEMDGAAFLAAVRAMTPDTTRMLLTGQADLAGAAAVVNEGQVFRLLLKPVSPDALATALHGAVANHRLVVAEKELLEQTLQGSVTALVEVLALISPTMFARAARVRRLAGLLLDQLGTPDRWAMDLAAALSELGAVALPPALPKKVENKLTLSPAERDMIDRVPEVSEKLLAGIPRLGPVRNAIRYSRKGYDGTGLPSDDVRGSAIPLGGRVLRLVQDYDDTTSRGASISFALELLEQNARLYDPGLLHMFSTAVSGQGIPEIRKLTLDELMPGMVLDEELQTTSGSKLVPRGQEITVSVLERVRNFAGHGGVAEPISVIVPRSD